MKRVGICTLYFANSNYGANLQAYALRRIVASLGYEAEVISYYDHTRIRRVLSFLKQSLIKQSPLSRDVAIRKAAVDRFNRSIPHSKLYFSNTIRQANKHYDIFITGSDQVWNPDWINPCMSLSFVDKSKRTIAYAASTGKIHLDGEQQRKLQQALKNTEYVSVREKESIPALKALTDKEIVYVVDPTMLLEREDWDAICARRMISEEYIFCYFLGSNENLRKTALVYAKLRGLKLVTLPYLNGAYRSVDDSFGDYTLYDISPEEFLSLIRYASFIISDSFHGAVFSLLYEREFVVSSKRGDEMGCRLQSLTELFGTEERYISDHELVSPERLMAFEWNPLRVNRERYEAMYRTSLEFLQEALENER